MVPSKRASAGRCDLGSAPAASQARRQPRAAAQGPKATSRPAQYEVVVRKNVMIPMRTESSSRRTCTIRPGTAERPQVDSRRCSPALPITRTEPSGKAVTSPSAATSWSPTTFGAATRARERWRLIADDPQDGFEVVEWIARQEWSDGKIGTFGTSYPGGTQHALAEMNPPHLTTMVPIDSVSNCGVSGMRHGGAFELRFFNWIFQTGAPNSKAALANPALQQALAESGRRIREHADSLPIRPGTTPLRVVPEYESWLVEAMRSGPESPFWHKKGMSVVDHVGDYADVPVLHITGWYDSWTRQVTMNYEALRKAKKSPQRLVIGPWTHGGQNANTAGEVEFTREAGIDLRAFHVRWYDRWLRGEKNGVDDDPPVLLYIMGTGDDRRSPGGRLQTRRVLASRTRMADRASPGDDVLPDLSRHARSQAAGITIGQHHLHLRPAAAGADRRRQHLIEPGTHDQRRI